VSGISTVVPVYRSARSLPELHERLTAVLSKITDRYEIILVEDSGGDDSWSEIMRLASLDSHVRGIAMSRNFGQHNALLCGIRPARYEVIVTLDDDLQNPPEEVATLLARLSDDVDVVYGYPEFE
jgi:glycosyltransferase involved in cell wall biosynthesis